MHGERVERRQRHLIARRLDALGRAGNEVALVLVARRVIAFPAGEPVNDLARGAAIARQADAEQRIERLHHDEQVVGPEREVHEAANRIARPRGIGGVHVVLVEEDCNEPPAVARGGLPFVRGRADDDWRVGSRRRGGDAHCADRFDRERRALLPEVEVRRFQIGDRSSARVGRDHVDGDQAARRRCALRRERRRAEPDAERDARGVSP